MTLLKIVSTNYVATSELDEKLFSNNGTSSTTQKHSPTANRSLRFNAFNVAAEIDFGTTYYNDIILSFYFYFDDNQAVTSGSRFIEFSRDGSVQFSIDHLVTPGFTLRTNDQWTNLNDNFSKTIPGEMWHHCSARWQFSNSIGANTCILKINGEEYFNLPATTDTQAQGSTGINRIRLGCSNPDIYYDEILIMDTAGSVNNAIVTPGHVVESLRPNANGTTNNFTGSDGNSTDNYLLVDDSDSDGDTTYSESATVNDIDLYGYENLTGTPTTIMGVQINSFMRKTDASTRHITNIIRSGGTNYDGSAGSHTLTETYDFYEDVEETNPNTASAWTATNVNAAEFGVEVTT